MNTGKTWKKGGHDMGGERTVKKRGKPTVELGQRVNEGKK